MVSSPPMARCNFHRGLFVMLCLSLSAELGCSGSDGTKGGTDAGSTTDAGGTIDGGGGTDGGSVADAGGPSDAGRTDGSPELFDAGGSDAGGSDAGGSDAGSSDAGSSDAGSSDAGPSDAGPSDAGPSDAGPAYSYNCGAFSTDPGWTVETGFRAVVVADGTDGLNDPVAAVFAEGGFGGLLYVVNQGNDRLLSVDVATGNVETVVDTGDWGTAPLLLTTITWDAEGAFDGNLYVGDQGGDGDNDSRIYRVTAAGAATSFAAAPGDGMDDIYGLAFAPSASAYTAGLYVTGDTDGSNPDWGRVDAAGTVHAFSVVPGTEGIAFDPTGLYGNQLWASRPAGGGYAGADAITPIDTAGAAGTALATSLPGIHAVTFSTRGGFGRNMYAASWSTGRVLRIDPAGTVTELASGLSLTNYDGNILAVSSDGNVMFVADREANRVVCFEPI